MTDTTARLLINCPDAPGIVSAVSSFLYNHGANITDLDQLARWGAEVGLDPQAIKAAAVSEDFKQRLDANTAEAIATAEEVHMTALPWAKAASAA